MECWFAPLLKDAKLDTVTIKIVEKQIARLEATASESVRHNVRYMTAAQSSTVFSKTIDFSQGDELLENDCSELEWRFSTSVNLPQGLEKCSQSVSTKPIKITHELVVSAEFGNEAGHVTAKVCGRSPTRTPVGFCS